ncbi:MAG: SPOR domain-containing protein [Rhodoferax sp.]|nr:SPOR domain-containing protein [Rhodoferax sp.]MCB2004738.1 SPOR domain-containing protein [Rhodoferax sp.]MCP5264241.1 SPOR domain-containing protein [Rhodoferax sp.]
MPETHVHASAADTEPTRLDLSTGSHLDTLYRAAIGPMQADYYLPILSRFETYGRASPSWNWAAFGITLNWMLFRGLWWPAVVYLAALAAAVLALAAGMALADPPLPASVQWSLWAALLTMALLVPGFFGNAWLYRVYRKRLDQALTGTANLDEACMRLARQSSTRPRLFAIALGNLALAALVGIGSWPSDLHVRMWPRVSGDIASLASPESGAAPPPATATAEAAPATDTSVAAPGAADNTQPAETPPAVTPEAAPMAAASEAEPPAQATVDMAASDASAPTPAPETPDSADPAPDTPPQAPPAGDATTTTLADFDLGAQGPAARAAAERQATLASRARAARLRPVAPATAATPAASAAAVEQPSKRPVAQTGRYLINVGLFAQQDNALRAHARLKEAGLPAISDSLQMRNGQRTRVRVGPFATQAQADAAAERIRAMQLEAVVIRQ